MTLLVNYNAEEKQQMERKDISTPTLKKIWEALINTTNIDEVMKIEKESKTEEEILQKLQGLQKE